MNMKRRKLGQTGLRVSEIGFGTWQLGNSDDYDGMSDEEARELIAAARDAGIDLFDTAPNYANTRSEELLGKALKGSRHDVVIVSKYGHRGDGRRDFSVEGFWESLEDSLRRLGTDYLDVLLLHNPPQEMYEGKDALWEALQQAVDQGKIRHYGASLDHAQEVESCLRNTGSQVLEILFNILHQDVRRAFDTVRSRGAGLLAKVPLDSGWLTGRFDATSRFTGVRSRWTQAQIAHRSALVKEIPRRVSIDAVPTHLALSYLLAYDEVSTVIPGTRTLDQLESNLAAANTVLDPEDRARLEQFWEEITDSGRQLLPW